MSANKRRIGVVMDPIESITPKKDSSLAMLCVRAVDLILDSLHRPEKRAEWLRFHASRPRCRIPCQMSYAVFAYPNARQRTIFGRLAHQNGLK